MDVLILLLAASATALATGLGAVPVFLLGARAAVVRPALWGLTVGLMTVASFVGLLGPALDEGEPAAVAAGLVFSVLLVHSFPEGFAIGTAYASDRAGLSLFVILAIALQNIPEGTSVAIPMEAAGFRAREQFWAAVTTSAPQPVGALIAYVLVENVQALLPFSFAFAAGAMLALVAVELAREAFAGRTWPVGLAGTLVGAGLMLGLAGALGV